MHAPVEREFQNPVDDNVKYVTEAQADGLYVYKVHTAETSNTETLEPGVTQTTITTVITKTFGQSVTF